MNTNYQGLIVLAALAVIGITGCNDTEDTAEPVTPDSQTSAPTVHKTKKHKPKAYPATPSLSHNSCRAEWPLVINPDAHTLIASATLSNVGDKTGTFTATATWYPVGGPPVSLEKTLTVPANRSKRVDFSKPWGSAINGMVGLQHGDKMCSIKVK